MKVRDVSTAQIREIVTAVSNELYEGNIITDRLDDESSSRTIWTTFTLRVLSSKGRGHKVNRATGRRSVGACWHAHRDVLAAFFDRYPDARVQSMYATYMNRISFLDKFPETGYINVGSKMFPLLAKEACECEKV